VNGSDHKLGGTAICPGRLLAKRITLFTIAMMVRTFDIEILSQSLQLGSLKFGMGVDKPKKPIPFRIKKRVGIEIGDVSVGRHV
jgi:hypothetical protein